MLYYSWKVQILKHNIQRTFLVLIFYIVLDFVISPNFISIQDFCSVIGGLLYCRFILSFVSRRRCHVKSTVLSNIAT